MAINTSATGGALLPEDTKWDDPNAVYNQYGDFWSEPSPIYDNDIALFLQPIVAGITGLQGPYVRPRWQPVPPNLLANTINWVAMGTQNIECDEYAWIGHRSIVWDGQGLKFDSGQAYSDPAGGGPSFDTGATFDTGRAFDVAQPEYDKPGATFDDGKTFDIDAAAIQADILYVNETLELFLSFYGPNAQRMAARARDAFQISQNQEALKKKSFVFSHAGSITQANEQINKIWYNRRDLILYLRRSVIRAYPVLDIVSANGSAISDDLSMNRAFAVLQPSGG